MLAGAGAGFAAAILIAIFRRKPAPLAYPEQMA
jgi:hypothetical protein